MQLDLKTLFGKLNPVCKSALSAAGETCARRMQFEVQITHFLLSLAEASDSDLVEILHAFDIPQAGLVAELSAALEGYKTGNTGPIRLADSCRDLLQKSWVFASLKLDQIGIRSGAILYAVLISDERATLLEAVPSLRRIDPDRLRDRLPELFERSKERMQTAREAAKENAKAAKAASEGARTKAQTDDDAGLGSEEEKASTHVAEALDLYTISLTDQAILGAIDPIVGRDDEIRRMIDILMRRRQNNPILTGEAGVGKTAVVEGLAQRISDGDVPPPLLDVDLRSLDLGLLQAGASMKGEFEARLKGVVDAVSSSLKPIILFIDEAHTLIGAGGAQGAGDAANLLKPALARGELRTIAATTWAEYKKYVEKDAALTRRFQVVAIDEPSEENAIAMLRSLARRLEDHHKVRVLDTAIADAVRLSSRYIAGRQLPDKAVSVLDTACARVAVAKSGPPALLEAATRRVERLQVERDILKRERIMESDHQERLVQLDTDLEEAVLERDRLEALWAQEQDLLRDLDDLLSAAEETAPLGPAYQQKLDALVSVREAGGLSQNGMAPVLVDRDAVAGVVADWTGVPVGKMQQDEVETVLSLEDHLRARIIGQDEALATVAKRVRTYRAGLDDPSKPVGVFLFAGPSGVGKTETALAIADLLYGGEDRLITINMSEYQEAHTVSGLKGAPPGYVGYGEGGVLTEAVRRNPYSVVLLDEVEKAHPDVLELFFQVFDKGVMEDGDGVSIDFKNTIIILTSNIGDSAITQASSIGTNAVYEAAEKALRDVFKPAFLGRLIITPYLPLLSDHLRAIVNLKLSRIAARYEASHRASLSFHPSVAASLSARAMESESGARALDAMLTHGVLAELSEEVLNVMASGAVIGAAQVSIDAAHYVSIAIESPAKEIPKGKGRP